MVAAYSNAGSTRRCTTATDDELLIQVILGSTRRERFSERAGEWVYERLAVRGDMTVELIDLRDHPLPFFDAQAPARTLRNYPSPEVERLGQMLDRADGFVIVTPEYNHGYPAVLKNAMDFTFVEWQRKPVAFVGWGNVGGAERSSSSGSSPSSSRWRRCATPCTSSRTCSCPRCGPAPFDPTLLDPLEPRLKLLGDDLVWWAAALGAARRRDAEVSSSSSAPACVGAAGGA